MEAQVHRLEVPLQDGAPPLAVALLDALLDAGLGLLLGKDAGELEEGRLHDGVDAPRKTHFPGQLVGVHHVDLEVFLEDGLLNGLRQAVPDLLLGVGAVEEDRGPLLGHLQHGEAFQESPLVDAHEAGLADEVGLVQGVGAEAQVAHGAGARLLGIVDEVALGVEGGLLSDDLDGVLVGGDGAVGAKAKKTARTESGSSKSTSG